MGRRGGRRQRRVSELPGGVGSVAQPNGGHSLSPSLAAFDPLARCPGAGVGAHAEAPMESLPRRGGSLNCEFPWRQGRAGSSSLQAYLNSEATAALGRCQAVVRSLAD